MSMPAWMPEAWAQLNEADQKSVSDFMSFLLNRKAPAQEKTFSLKPLNYGVFKGRIKVPEGFADPKRKLHIDMSLTELANECERQGINILDIIPADCDRVEHFTAPA